MTTPELIAYIKSQTQSGVSKEALTGVLLRQGWTLSDIEGGFMANAEVAPAQSKEKPQEEEFDGFNIINQPLPGSVPAKKIQTNDQGPIVKSVKAPPVEAVPEFVSPVGAVGYGQEPQPAPRRSVVYFVPERKSHKAAIISIVIIAILICLGGVGAYAYFTMVAKHAAPTVVSPSVPISAPHISTPQNSPSPTVTTTATSTITSTTMGTSTTTMPMSTSTPTQTATTAPPQTPVPTQTAPTPAKTSNADMSNESALLNAQLQAQIAVDTGTSSYGGEYAGFCDTSAIISLKNKVAPAQVSCVATADAYAITLQLSQGYYCVDSSGRTVKDQPEAAISTSCSQ